MKEQQWTKHVTLRLSDGFYMYRKVFSKDDKSLAGNQGAKTNNLLTRNHSVQTLSWIPNGPTNTSKKPGVYLDRASYNQPPVQLCMTPEYSVTGSKKKGFVGVPTPGRPIPSDVNTPKSLSELDKYHIKSSVSRNEKRQQYPSPYLGPNAISLVKLLIRDARYAQKRRRHREKRERKKKKRRKVITRYPSIHIPSFPLPPIDQIRREFALTEEARLATSNPKNGFIQLTNMIVGAQKQSIGKVYRDDGPFAFIAKACAATLDLFREKMIAKSKDSAIAKFERSSRKHPRELELANALKCIRERHDKVNGEVQKMVKLKEQIVSGKLEAAVCEKIYPLPQAIQETNEFVKEETLQNENLQRSHNTLSKIVMENLTIKLTERWLRFEEESNKRQEQLKMSSVYAREIASAGLPTVRSIVKTLGAISLSKRGVRDNNL